MLEALEDARFWKKEWSVLCLCAIGLLIAIVVTFGFNFLWVFVFAVPILFLTFHLVLGEALLESIITGEKRPSPEAEFWRLFWPKHDSNSDIGSAQK